MFLSLMSVGLILLVIFHSRYSFVNSASSGWSIGVQKFQNPVNDWELSPATVLNPEWLKRYSKEDSRFLADPFVVKEDSIFYVFFEHQAEGNADIGLLTSEDGVEFEYKGDVLDEDFHLSFPQIFKHNGCFYMLPETKAAGNLLLYKAESFPYHWKIQDTLVANVTLKDPAILLSEDLNLITAIDDNNFQYVYTSDSLQGDWRRDKRFKMRKGDETRSGGNFFRYQNVWYIPFQKNNRGYGSGLALYRLIADEDYIGFEEVVDPFLERTEAIEWFNKGMHHFSVIPIDKGYYSVFDGDKIDKDLPSEAAWKASLKYNYYDLLRFLGK